MHAWNACVRKYREFESHPLRHQDFGLIAGSCATKNHELRQVREEATVVNLIVCKGSPGYHFFNSWLTPQAITFRHHMSYLVLARKSRPQTFDEVVGQFSIVRTLKNSLRQNRVAHAILFSGVRGVGKTTLARIMAKAINCESEIDNVPCNQCNSCKEITEGSAIDLYEIDGASNRGIQEIRELKEKIRFLPTSARFKIIIIDEVHMLTTEAFNALLKTLEEPPKHVHFMFATTELHKIPITILSRCQRYELQRISTHDLTNHFFKLADSEGRKIDESAMALIVRESDGSVRDGLSLLDQVFTFSDQEINKEDVIEVLGLIDRDILIRITHALLDKRKGDALLALDNGFSYGIDIKRFTSDLLECFRTLLFIKIQGCQQLIDMGEVELNIFRELAEKYSAETIHLQLNLLMKMAEEIRFSFQPRLTLETTFIKIIEAGNVTPVVTLLDHLDTLLANAPQVTETERDQQSQLPEKTSHVSPPTADQPPIEHEPVVQQPQPVPAKAKPKKNIQPASESPTTPPPIPSPEPPEPISSDISPADQADPPVTEKQKEVPPQPLAPVEIHPHERDVRRDWHDFTEYVKDRKVWMAKDLQRADSAKEVDDELHIQYSDPANCTLLRNKDNHKLLTEFALDFFQKELKVRFIIPDQTGNGDTDEANSPQMKRQRLANDPLVQMTVEIFGGQVGDIRIGPRSRT